MSETTAQSCPTCDDLNAKLDAAVDASLAEKERFDAELRGLHSTIDTMQDSLDAARTETLHANNAAIDKVLATIKDCQTVHELVAKIAGLKVPVLP